jgi:predicted O-methyltransferase YrrM
MTLRIEELASQKFQPLRYGLGAWTEHIFFAYDLVAELKPRLLVELGTDRGESYFAFCQSALENRTRTRCFAIDHWRGDPHAGSYDETTFADVSAHNREHYSDFSTLIRASFDEALGRFAPKSIDLLHIDGHHTEAAVRHDLEFWLPKVRPGGIVLMHDIAVRRRDFGVWKVWKDRASRGRSWSFSQSPGLGVWEKPPARAQPPLLETLFASPNESQTALVDHYRERSAALQRRIAQQWRDGSIRFSPMASETVIQIFWTSEGNYTEENSVDLRVGHDDWKEVTVRLPAEKPVSGLRIDFYSALTTIEIGAIEVRDAEGRPVYEAQAADEFAWINVLGDCRLRSLSPFCIQITGVDPQLHLPVFAAPVAAPVVRMRMKVESVNEAGGPERI